MENNESCCIAKVLKVIDILQKECNNECFPEGCDRPFLGGSGLMMFNTRPITLYTRTGSLFAVEYYEGTTLNTSSVFRVENVNDCCATLRILETTVVDGVTTYTSTNEFVTVNLECFCIIRCLSDTYIEI